MKPDIPIIGQATRSNRLLTTDLFALEFAKINDHAKEWADRIKINELRKSCGVEDKSTFTINVRRPPSYQSKTVK